MGEIRSDFRDGVCTLLSELPVLQLTIAVYHSMYSKDSVGCAISTGVTPTNTIRLLGVPYMAYRRKAAQPRELVQGADEKAIQRASGQQVSFLDDN